MLTEDDEKFIEENKDWLREQVKDIENNSYKADKFCGVKSCDNIIEQKNWGRWKLCKKHKDIHDDYYTNYSSDKEDPEKWEYK